MRWSSRGKCGMLALVLSMGMLGCGGGNDGPARYDVSGKVTFDGQPVPYGTIVFEPDAAKGNTGPQGVATIENGAYDTARGGTGIVGGATIVRITGLSEKADVGSETPKKALFEEYEISEDLPKSTSTKDFAVPKSAADARPRAAQQQQGP